MLDPSRGPFSAWPAGSEPQIYSVEVASGVNKVLLIDSIEKFDGALTKLALARSSSRHGEPDTRPLPYSAKCELHAPEATP